MASGTQIRSSTPHWSGPCPSHRARWGYSVSRHATWNHGLGPRGPVGTVWWRAGPRETALLPLSARRPRFVSGCRCFGLTSLLCRHPSWSPPSSDPSGRGVGRKVRWGHGLDANNRRDRPRKALAGPDQRDAGGRRLVRRHGESEVAARYGARRNRHGHRHRHTRGCGRRGHGGHTQSSSRRRRRRRREPYKVTGRCV